MGLVHVVGGVPGVDVMCGGFVNHTMETFSPP